MKALSVHPVYAMAIFAKQKTIECRTWKTDYRGDIVICSTKKNVKDTIPSHALCVVELVNVRPFRRTDCEAALMLPQEYDDGLFAWELANVRYIEPVKVKGKLSLWNFDKPLVYLDEPATEAEDMEIYKKYYEPLFV